MSYTISEGMLGDKGCLFNFGLGASKKEKERNYGNMYKMWCCIGGGTGILS